MPKQGAKRLQAAGVSMNGERDHQSLCFELSWLQMLVNPVTFLPFKIVVLFFYAYCIQLVAYNAADLRAWLGGIVAVVAISFMFRRFVGNIFAAFRFSRRKQIVSVVNGAICFGVPPSVYWISAEGTSICDGWLDTLIIANKYTTSLVVSKSIESQLRKQWEENKDFVTPKSEDKCE